MKGRSQLSATKRALLEKRLAGRSNSEAEEQAIRTVPRNGPVPLSFAQQRLWFLDQLEPGLVAYNIPAAVRLVGRLDVPVLNWSLNEIVRRHESLRTTFDVVAGEPVQVIAPALELSIPIVDLTHLARRCARGGSDAPVARRSAASVRSHAWSTDSRLTAAAANRRTCADPDDASHRQRRLVAGCAEE